MPSCRDGLQSSVARVRRLSCTCVVWLMLKKCSDSSEALVAVDSSNVNVTVRVVCVRAGW